ncbi:MAG: site-specific integrase [Flavobacteriales bacterium]|nr:site-specific integrase [Flavobacteriales bacterium]PIV94082.1 MAG: integrase [Flavobacteriaceae bacterium CG17_big_fil_post_rev_8_21_14_2_50_33_15]PIY13472.1 MAG: integrase [Flavobacteriaceae bacterium CG_4_10_14_3_um_filter_33_47]PJB17256.1 MAG: integrase [Flavobacteriaceae bacterium CG_4_9_14_3_um_filter_33_16]NCP59251.1 site-specific integrase [Flavobacteriales bacterium]
MKTRSTFSLLFWVNTSRIKNDQVPVYARITVNGKRTNISLQRRLPVSNWDSNRGMAKGTKQSSKLLNKYIEQVRAKIYESYEDLLSEDKLITSQSIKSKFLGEDESNKTLLELFEYHNEVSQEKLNNHTLRHYKVTQGYLIKFLNEKLKTTDMSLQSLNYSFIVDFEHFIKSYKPKDNQKKMSHNTAMKHLQRLRKMVTMAYHLEWIIKDPFVRFKSSFENKRREFLTENELNSLEQFHSSIERLNMIKDLFLFSCYTGISYVDINSLTPDNIIFGIDGNHWINTKRKKTNSFLAIPLLNQAKNLIKKYEGHQRTIISNTLFPCFSNQKINSYLKEIAELSGIKKNLTFHMARHTFATTVTLSNGVPIETVSKLLGHTKIATTQIYARVINKKVSEDMNKLSEKLKVK